MNTSGHKVYLIVFIMFCTLLVIFRLCISGEEEYSIWLWNSSKCSKTFWNVNKQLICTKTFLTKTSNLIDDIKYATDFPSSHTFSQPTDHSVARLMMMTSNYVCVWWSFTGISLSIGHLLCNSRFSFKGHQFDYQLYRYIYARQSALPNQSVSNLGKPDILMFPDDDWQALL